MKDISELAGRIEEIEPLEEGEEGLSEEYLKLCGEIIEVTHGPAEASVELTKQTVKAINRVVPLADENERRVRRIVGNALKLIIGVFLKGGVVQVNKTRRDMEELVEDVVEGDDHVGRVVVDMSDPDAMEKVTKMIEEVKERVMSQLQQRKETIH